MYDTGKAAGTKLHSNVLDVGRNVAALQLKRVMSLMLA